jgi:hypothetical protein
MEGDYVIAIQTYKKEIREVSNEEVGKNPYGGAGMTHDVRIRPGRQPSCPISYCSPPVLYGNRMADQTEYFTDHSRGKGV